MKLILTMFFLSLMYSAQSIANPRSEALTDIFNGRFGSKNIDRVDFTHPEPNGWRSPNFTRAGEDFGNAIRKYNLTNPPPPPPPPNVPSP